MSKLTERLRGGVYGIDRIPLCKEAADSIEHLERVLVQARDAFDNAVESARLLGGSQSKKGFGYYTEDDARFEVAMYQSIAKHRAAIDDALKEKP